eukprot:2388226-Pyramimonas_sp.AAC.1
MSLLEVRKKAPSRSWSSTQGRSGQAARAAMGVELKQFRHLRPQPAKMWDVVKTRTAVGAGGS